MFEPVSVILIITTQTTLVCLPTQFSFVCCRSVCSLLSNYCCELST